MSPPSKVTKRGAPQARAKQHLAATTDRIAIHANGIAFNVQVAGDGPSVLLLHGFPDDSTVWRKQIPDLVEAGYRVIAPDLRGCGASDAPADINLYRLDMLVSDVEAILDAMGCAKVHLVAHDWGAVIGWQFCMIHPDRVDSYVALSVGHPSAYASASIEQKLRGYYILLFQLRGVAEWLLSHDNWRLFRKLVGYAPEVEHWIANLSRPGRLTAAINYYRANLSLLLPRKWPAMTRPAMGVWSDRDAFLTEAQMAASACHTRSGWCHYRIGGVKHWLQLEAPEAANALILSFLAETTRNEAHPN